MIEISTEDPEIDRAIAGSFGWKRKRKSRRRNSCSFTVRARWTKRMCVRFAARERERETLRAASNKREREREREKKAIERYRNRDAIILA